MINFEYYKDEIEKAINDKSLYTFLKKHGYEGEVCYAYELTEWYFDEHDGPYKLTKLEKTILENLNPNLIYIIREGNAMYITESDKWTGIYAEYLFPDAKFGCLKDGVYYKITDILLDCEVIDND